MTWLADLAFALPAALSAFAYWRARRLHKRILAIEPHWRCPAAQLRARLFPKRK
ncbi:hypothetical protein [Novosphingobium colocasiae]|uniref:Uncharacterized protein n=1 Tax=Novosphingobium colocasiae TaxID=1256513 RepID=A0A918PEQ5_9SPHN|nr:hypothetical protein [Novosphingobium colocasiae]GGZ02684.1 hypothetical protein GCM10011614_17200 [Novosphingobium colocasiae]